MSPLRMKLALLGIVLLATISSPAVAAPGGPPVEAARAPSYAVPMPTVEGPITGPGSAWWATPYDLAEHGYVEEEFFLSGIASDRGLDGDGEQTAPYKVRILVRRPVDPARYNGTTVLEWANVSFQFELDHDWPISGALMMRDGYVSAMVSAQSIGVQGPAPTSLKNWDPARYGSLEHPGDQYSYDIYAQAARAIRSGLLTDELVADRVIGSGTSQSCLRLLTYIPELAAGDGVFDGFMPTLCPASASIPDDLVPIMWGNSESEAQLPSRADGLLLRVWDIPGTHINYYEASQGEAQIVRDVLGGSPTWSEDVAGQYGERGLIQARLPGGLLFGNTLPARYSFRAALHHLDRWIRETQAVEAGTMTLHQVTAPPSAPRFRNLGLAHDLYGNVKGGVPQPALEVPVATYGTVSFAGTTIPLDPLRLRLLYPTHQVYVTKMQAAVDRAVADGYLLPVDAAEWMDRVRAAPIPG